MGNDKLTLLFVYSGIVNDRNHGLVGNIIKDFESMYPKIALELATDDVSFVNAINTHEPKIILADDISVAVTKEAYGNNFCDFTATYGILSLLAGGKTHIEYDLFGWLKNSELALAIQNLKKSDLIIITTKEGELDKKLEERLAGTKLKDKINLIIKTSSERQIFDGTTGNSELYLGLNEYLSKNHPGYEAAEGVVRDKINKRTYF